MNWKKQNKKQAALSAGRAEKGFTMIHCALLAIAFLVGVPAVAVLVYTLYKAEGGKQSFGDFIKEVF